MTRSNSGVVDLGDLPSSGEAQGELFLEICYGLEGDYNIHTTDKTNKTLHWCHDWKEDVRKLSQKDQTRSQTEIEMVMSRKAIGEINQALSGSIIDWLPYLNDLVFCVKKNSDSRNNTMARFQGGKSNLSTLRIDSDEKRDHVISILTEDARKIRTNEEDYGFPYHDRLKCGLSYVVLKNKPMFSPGTVQGAEAVVGQFERQMEYKESMRGWFVDNMAEALADSIEADDVYYEYLHDTLVRIGEEAPELAERLKDEMPDEYNFPEIQS